MKKNMIWIILGTVVVVVLAIVVIMLLIGVFKKPEPIPFTETGKDFVVIGENGSDIGKADYVTYDGYVELIALADSEDDAKEIAELYGIELKRFENGVAVFVTKENPADVIKRGEENGWPTVSVNTIIHLSPVETSSGEKPIFYTNE